MSIEEDIVAWAAGRPAWQRSVLRRVASVTKLSQADYARIANGLTSDEGETTEQFSLSDISAPHESPERVRLLSVSITRCCVSL